LSEPKATCPLCGAEREYSARYPRAVCHDCYRKATDEHGRPLKFSNVSFSGGLVGFYADTGEDYPSEVCWIEGRRCRASEAHMGGTVILAEEAPK
jgi:hypothetical protein